jgi:hypothetical protein
MFRIRLLGLLVALIGSAPGAWGYGPFNHLCAADRNWPAIYKQIQAVGPLDESRALDAVFAGAIADDLGYYPFNSRLKDLTNQVHYIRTGEWVDFLLRSARSRPGSDKAVAYAFALGVLSHYAVDRMGHYYGTNVVAVSLAGQQLLFGPRMSYERDPGTHKKVEAGFDLLSLGSSCQADQLSDRFYAFLNEPGWPDGEQVFGFLVNALRRFYGYSAVESVSDLTHALIFARKYSLRLLQQEGGPYASARIKSNQPGTGKSAPGFYASQTPAEIAAEDAWIEQQIKLGRSLREAKGSADFLPVFAGSFGQAQRLLLGLLQSAAQLRARQEEELKKSQTIEMDTDTFPNINLDTNQLSVSGRYDLADCTAAQLIAKNSGHTGTPVVYPPKSGELAPFFAPGPLLRATMDAPASSDEATLHQQLRTIAGAFSQEQRPTLNVLAADSSWTSVKFVHQNFPAPGECPKQPAVIPFGDGKNVCVGPNAVYWQGRIRALSLLFAASAAAQKDRAQSELGQRREAVESFRLCDTNKPAGYRDARLCKDGEPTTPMALPTAACVNQD